MKDKTSAKTDNLKTASDSAAQAARAEKERVRQVPAPGPPEPSTTIRGAPKDVSGREQEVSTTVLKTDFIDVINTHLNLDFS